VAHKPQKINLVTKEKVVKKNQDIKTQRKALKKSTAAHLGISVDKLGWINGTLCFTKNNSPVPGVPKVSKPARSRPVEPVRKWRHDPDPYYHRAG
jgi:hypothetical protein